ncbi:efflux transporter outer membrane subunit [Tamlana sp. 2_MG-2023]|uniref:TolC family protein n=1 Tax=unclassified Tamlana TaxID=2614803 RepID=UPI0026E34F5E|nr:MULTISPECIES: efflux transporter outer membrane subunit [unclassified Tamlana]MDO6760667.1 efflux transporter outer membrane subunit [Tamlana sp. 2_MG-2023]MDO6790923.1 efflux transporter outer membrane subunit [Tamlana sp. 1_MG-2023]
MNKKKATVQQFKKIFLLTVILLTTCYSCVPTLEVMQESKETPSAFKNQTTDTLNTAKVKWNDYFTDVYLSALIEEALKNNQELNITLQEVDIARNEVRAKKGEYLPFVDIRGGAEVEKVGRYTSQGANDANTDIKPGKEFPEPLGNYGLALEARWELDIWKKLRNAKKAAYSRYISSVEGKNFLVTNLISEIANSYYELLTLDTQLSIVQENIGIQSNALRIVKLQKEAARVTELAVSRFEAEVLHTKSLRFDIQQQITETESKINFLVGRYPQSIERSSESFYDLVPNTLLVGVPAQLLDNRPDIREAELELEAAKLDIKVAKARFYPSIGISAGVGFEAFDPSLLLETPASLIYSLVGDMAGPLINRNEIKALYYNASAKQIQAVYNYERTVLNAYLEVANQLSNISNLEQSFDLKSKKVEALTRSIDISNTLFKSARADYMEVLLTQRDALESKFELVETKKEQMGAVVNMYRALGGGWN